MIASKAAHLSCSKEQMNFIAEGLKIVLLEEWGGPRSPLALEYLKCTIIPDLMYCFQVNGDILCNPTFVEIISWKLRNQFAYPKSIVDDLAKDLLRPVQEMCITPQILDPKEPWYRIFRLWISDESLSSIAERTGYAFDYLDLLIIRYKKLKLYLTEHKLSLSECLQNSELKGFGFEQLSFFYQLQASLNQEPLFKEQLILEQVIFDQGLPLKIPDLASLLEIILFHEGKLKEDKLFPIFRKVSGNNRKDIELSVIVRDLISIQYILKNKAGYLTLSEKSAKVISCFLLPKIIGQLQQAMDLQDYNQVQSIINKQNPEVLELLITWMVENIEPDKTVKILIAYYKKISRRFDLQILDALSHFSISFDFLFDALGEKDSLLRAKACEAIAYQGNKNAVFCLIRLLRDPVSEVKEKAAFALGEIGSFIGSAELKTLSEDYNESLAVREQARIALGKISYWNKNRNKL